jgi:glucose-6-phosphate isomerase
LAAEAVGICLDYSKNRVTGDTIRLLVRLAEECGLRERIAAMFRGERINVTEQRAVLHTALRAPETERVVVDGVDIVPEVHAVLERMAAFSREVRSGRTNPELESTDEPTLTHGSSTNALVRRYRRLKNRRS